MEASKPVAHPKRLIEIDLPIRRISLHARDEKDSRCAHIPRLHIYPAARPLAACRAVLCAALWPDPADDACPASFRETARIEMLSWTSHQRQILLSEDSRKRFEAARQTPSAFNRNAELRQALLDFIADFAKWENGTREEYVETARTLTQVAHRSLMPGQSDKPFVVDPFAGGGAIPLEALRVGADSFASDLNPLAVLINRVILEHIPRFGDRLIGELERFEEWQRPRAEELLRRFYPDDEDGSTPIAYLWSRTVLSEAPGPGKYAIEVPLLRSLWLTRGRDSNWALRWVRDEAGNVVTTEVEVNYANGEKRRVRRPQLEVFRPTDPREVAAGTVRRGSAVCPVTNYATPVARVRAQLSARKGGTNDARMYCVVLASLKGGGRSFRAATEKDINAAKAASMFLEESEYAALVPSESLPPGGTNGFRVQNYGIHRWRDLFLPRQNLILGVYTTLVRAFVSSYPPSEEGLRLAAESVLALFVNRLADLNASLCAWQLNTANSAHVFVRWAVPMVFDCAEVNPLARAGGSPESALRRIKACIADLQLVAFPSGTASQNSAIALPLPDDMAAAVVTDPPYYDAIPYSDLLDFFVVRMTRVCVNQSFVLADGLSPKAEECVVDRVKNKDHVFFQKTMTSSMVEARRVLSPSGIAVVVFAHKSTAGWEAQLDGLIDAGFAITASWPIDTEMGSRMRAQDSAALASSIHLVCRPRENLDGSLRMSEVGDWRDVLQELPPRIHEWMPRLAEEGVVGADAIFACLGPALEIFSRYSRVEKASGERVALKEYLEHVWAAVSKEALSMIFAGASTEGFEADARLTAMWLWTLAAPLSTARDDDSDDSQSEDDDESSPKKAKIRGYTLEFDAARKIAQGLGAAIESLGNLIEVAGDKARLLPVSERTHYLFGKEQAGAPSAKKKEKPQLEMFAALTQSADIEMAWGEKAVSKPGETTLDRIHQSMILFAAGRGEALKRFLTVDGAGRDQKFWRLAQALSALYPPATDEKRWVDGVLARKKGLGL